MLHSSCVPSWNTHWLVQNYTANASNVVLHHALALCFHDRLVLCLRHHWDRSEPMFDQFLFLFCGMRTKFGMVLIPHRFVSHSQLGISEHFPRGYGLPPLESMVQHGIQQAWSECCCLFLSYSSYWCRWKWKLRMVTIDKCRCSRDLQGNPIQTRASRSCKQRMSVLRLWIHLPNKMPEAPFRELRNLHPTHVFAPNFETWYFHNYTCVYTWQLENYKGPTHTNVYTWAYNRCASTLASIVHRL
jgi:hypothetical protein